MCSGIQTLETGVFGGILVGLMVYWLHEKFYKTELPIYLGFFSGSRFVSIICAFSSIFLGILMYAIWPSFQLVIFNFGEFFKDTGYIGTLIYGFLLRMPGIFGLHHIFYLPFWTTGLGGSEIVNGQLIEGTQRIFFAQLSDPSVTKYYEGIIAFYVGQIYNNDVRANRSRFCNVQKQENNWRNAFFCRVDIIFNGNNRAFGVFVPVCCAVALCFARIF